MMICPRELRKLAGRKVASAVQSGKLPKVKTLFCIDCGEPAKRYDHRDYTKPLDVDAVCHLCDNRRGQGLPEINGPCVEIDWEPAPKASICGDCSCPTFGRRGNAITAAIDARRSTQLGG